MNPAANFLSGAPGGSSAAKSRRAPARTGTSPALADSRMAARPAIQAWPEIRARLRSAKRWAIFLDFDGTLVNLRSRPGDVRISAIARRILKRLAAHEHLAVAIVSGRKLDNLRNLVGVAGLRYFGLHGGEREGKSAEISREAMAILKRARRLARMQLSTIAKVWVEDKDLSFSVHYRGAGASARPRAAAILRSVVAPWGDALHILNGSRVWEVLPREIPGKSSAVEEVLGKLPSGTGAIYIGDDGTDEVAFAVLPDEITVRVGRDPSTRARYFVRAPADVLRLLDRVEKELR
jgi:trehalose 6-phosphate phosphatase